MKARDWGMIHLLTYFNLPGPGPWLRMFWHCQWGQHTVEGTCGTERDLQ